MNSTLAIASRARTVASPLSWGQSVSVTANRTHLVWRVSKASLSAIKQVSGMGCHSPRGIHRKGNASAFDVHRLVFAEVKLRLHSASVGFPSPQYSFLGEVLCSLSSYSSEFTTPFWFDSSFLNSLLNRIRFKISSSSS